MRFDDLVNYLGDFGPYQKKVYFLLCYPMLTAAFQKLMWVFMAAPMDHVCKLPDDGNAAFWNSSQNLESQDFTFHSCTINRTATSSNEYYETKCTDWTYNSSQYTSSVISDFDLVCDRKWLSALTMSLQMGGEFFGSVLLGILSDKYGRKKIMVVSALMLALSGVVCSFSTGIVMLIICRIMVGFWTPGTVLIAYVVGMEFVGPSKRVFAGIVSQFFFSIGYILIAVIAYYVRSWRPLTIALSVPGLLMISFYWLVPESVRWLLTNNKRDEAIKIIKTIAKSNKVELSESFYLNEFNVENKPKASLRELMRHPNLRKRTFIVVYCWFVNTCVYYGLSLNTSNLAGDHYINFALAAAVEFPAYAVCLFVLDKLGRRIPICLSLILSGISLFIIPFIPEENIIISSVLAMIGKFAITTSYAIVYMFTAEVFPTSVRSASCGLSSTCGRIGAMLAPVALLLRNYWLPLTPLIFSILSITAGFLCLLLPETLGRELPDTIEEAENFTKNNGITKESIDLMNGKEKCNGKHENELI